jgi:hypothetical protein
MSGVRKKAGLEGRPLGPAGFGKLFTPEMNKKSFIINEGVLPASHPRATIGPAWPLSLASAPTTAARAIRSAQPISKIRETNPVTH